MLGVTSSNASSGGSDSGSELGLNEQRDGSIIDKLWMRSPSPAEDFSNAEGGNENGQWDVNIIGEEVDGQGEVK